MFYLLLCALAGVIGLGFWLQGVEAVLVFTGLELLAVGLAMLLMARHAGDREVITLANREMAVEQHVGPLVECTRFHADWVRVEPCGGEGSLVGVLSFIIRTRSMRAPSLEWTVKAQPLKAGCHGLPQKRRPPISAPLSSR